MADLILPTLLLLLGLGLLAAEVFLPSGGLLGLSAAAALGASLYLAYAAPGGIGPPWVFVEAVAVPTAWLGAAFGFPRTPLGRAIFLQPPGDADLGAALEDRPAAPRVGTAGRSLTPLRPSGMIDVAGDRIEAIAESGLIAAGVAVTVVASRSGRAVVRES